jgi:agmatine/peptidylarginine deiminase
MSVESIIGIVAGIFGILTGIAWMHGEISKRIKSKSSNVLFKKLTDKKLSDARKREILVKLNKSSIVKGRIKQDYIKDFKWENKRIEKLFLDFCEKNDIEPDDDICLDLLDSRMPSLQRLYKENKQNKEASIDETSKSKRTQTITNSYMKQTIYFSEYIIAYKCWNNIREALEVHGVSFGLLKNTKDIWARDYMPAHSAIHTYVSYKYNPDYLQECKEYITDNIRDVFDFSKDSLFDLDLVIDGGNIIVCGDKVIMTDKIFVENPKKSKEQIIELIEKAFSAKLIIIPWDKEEKFGHADGMVRYVSKDHVLINNYKDIDPDLRQRILDALSPYFSKISELEYGSAQRVNSWAHINYLQVNDLIFVPQLEIPSDELALEQISHIFPDSTIIPVEVKGIVKKGGALNCVTWNYFEY